MIGERNRLALEPFAPLGPTYDRYARLLSLGQDPRWRPSSRGSTRVRAIAAVQDLTQQIPRISLPG